MQIRSIYHTGGKGFVLSFKPARAFSCHSSSEIPWGFSNGLFVGVCLDMTGSVVSLKDFGEFAFNVFIGSLRFEYWKMVPAVQ
jgi:hypothetical protein